MKCDNCDHWKTAEKTTYDDGSEVVNKQAPDGKGHCLILDVDTAPEFGCTSFAEGYEHVIRHQKSGAPWQHFKMGPCPGCAGAGSKNDGACHRCAGTANVRYYDDGFVGEEQTRMHPKEKEARAQATPTCSGCKKEVTVTWVACPYCGTKLIEPPAPVENVSDVMGGTNAGPDAMAKAAEDRRVENAAEAIT